MDNTIVDTSMIEDFINDFIRNGKDIAIKLLIASFVLFISWRIIKLVIKYLEKLLIKRKVEPLVHNFILSFCKILLRVLLFFVITAILGLKLSFLVAALGALSLSVGLAFQGAISNFAGGLLLLVLRPIKLGDYVEIADKKGIVKDMHFFYTIINTIDNKQIIMPNSAITNTPIVNYTRNGIRRVDILFNVSYESDFREAIKILKDVAINHPKVVTKIEPEVRVMSLGESSVDIIYRAWVKTEDYWSVYFDSLELGKEALNKNNIEIPYKKVDFNIISQDKNNDFIK